MNSQAHFKGRHVEGQIPDEPPKQFHVKSTDVQISTMICQASAEFTGAGIAEFHTPALSPRSTPPLPVITGRRLAAEGDGKHLWKSVCVCVDAWTHSQDKEFWFHVLFLFFIIGTILHNTGGISYSCIDLTVQSMNYDCRYNMPTVLVVKRIQGWWFRIDPAASLADKWEGASEEKMRW